jgi:hypothetical protein
MIVGGVLLAAGGGLAAGGWAWLVAAGLAPIIVAILPCVITCGFGLCMLGMSARGKSSATRVSGTATLDKGTMIRGGGSPQSHAVPSVIDRQNQNVT